MAKISRRPPSESAKEKCRERKKAWQKSRQLNIEAGLETPVRSSVSNAKSSKTIEEEKEERQLAVEGQLQVFRSLLPGILKKFADIKDPRNPTKIKHRLTVLLMYGLLMFVYQYSSRREANRNISKAIIVSRTR